MELREGPKFRSTWDLYKPLHYIKPHFKGLLSTNGEAADYSSAGDESEITLENYPVIDEYTDAEDITVDIDVCPEIDDYYDDDEDDREVDVVDITREDDNDSAVILSERGKPPVKKIKLSHASSSDLTSEDSNDGSEIFFKSLLPFMRQMTDIQKLRVRNTIQNVILHELEEGMLN